LKGGLMNKLELRKGLMGRIDRKYCSNESNGDVVITNFPSMSKFGMKENIIKARIKQNEIPLIKREKQTRFSIGKRR